MRWLNKGKELEQLVQQIRQSKIFLYGAGEIGKKVYDEISDEIEIEGFVDNSKAKQGKLYLGRPVYSLNEVSGWNDNIMFILTVGDNYIEEIRDEIKQNKEGVYNNILEYQDFLGLYLYYFKDKLYFKSLNVSVTQRCSLNCEMCSVLTPHIKNKKDFPLKDLKKDIDLFFSKIDNLGLLSIVGGEPFLYSYLNEYLEYVMKNYYSKIKWGKWNIITNGTIIPSDNILNMIHEFGGSILISDYSNTLPDLKLKMQKLIDLLNRKHVTYHIFKAENWIDFGYNCSTKNNSDTEMQDFFEKCNMPCRLLQDKKLFYCANSHFAELAGMNEADSDNIFYLENFKKENGSELLEFDRGFSDRGFVKMCRRCNGYLPVNTHYVEVAKQIDK